MTSWFGFRGIGSVFYLLPVLRHGIEVRAAATLVSLMRRHIGWRQLAKHA